jgi:4-hydroxybenzoate polyprenyltransferase
MNRTTAKNAVIIGTLYLLAFIVTLYVPPLFSLVPWLFIGSPFVLCWMVVSILKDDRQPYPELGKHEWGYRDKNRDELGLF